jgi:hypothetical protein
MKTVDAVASKIRNGGARMPAFRHTFSDADVAALVSDLKSPCGPQILHPGISRGPVLNLRPPV